MLAGFARIVTKRIFADPAPTATALDFLARVRRARRGYSLPSSSIAWDRLGELASQDRAIRGNLVQGALLAGLALAHGRRVAAADRGFARFPGLRWFDPALPSG